MTITIIGIGIGNVASAPIAGEHVVFVANAERWANLLHRKKHHLLMPNAFRQTAKLFGGPVV